MALPRTPKQPGGFPSMVPTGAPVCEGVEYVRLAPDDLTHANKRTAELVKQGYVPQAMETLGTGAVVMFVKMGWRE